MTKSSKIVAELLFEALAAELTVMGGEADKMELFATNRFACDEDDGFYEEDWGVC